MSALSRCREDSEERHVGQDREPDDDDGVLDATAAADTSRRRRRNSRHPTSDARPTSRESLGRDTIRIDSCHGAPGIARLSAPGRADERSAAPRSTAPPTRRLTPPIGGHGRGSTGRSRRWCCSPSSSRSSCTISCTPPYSWNRDEPVYLWTVEALRSGQIFTSGGGAPRFFQPWLTGVHDGMFFSQYTLGLAARPRRRRRSSSARRPSRSRSAPASRCSAPTSSPASSPANHILATVSAAIMVASPILIVQSGIYISYLFSLGLGLIFGATLPRRAAPPRSAGR